MSIYTYKIKINIHIFCVTHNFANLTVSILTEHKIIQKY